MNFRAKKTLWMAKTQQSQRNINRQSQGLPGARDLRVAQKQRLLATLFRIGIWPGPGDLPPAH